MVCSVDAHLELAYVPVRELPSAAPGHRSCLLGRPDPEPVTHRVCPTFSKSSPSLSQGACDRARDRLSRHR